MEPDSTPTFQEITGPEAFLPEASGLPGWMMFVVIAILLALAAFFFFRNRRPGALGSLSPLEQAQHRLQKSNSLEAEELSLILRDYLSQITGSPVLYQTYEETAQLDNLPALSPKLRQDTETVLQSLSTHSYQASAPALSDLQKEVSTLITDIDRHQRKP